VACGPGSDVWLKLLLDEHLSPEIARQLRERGHDVIAVGEHAGLRGRPDRVHFAFLPAEQRAIVTRDLADFRPLLAEQVRRGGKTFGLVCVPRRFPLNRDGIGRLVRALDSLLLANPGVDAAIALGGEISLGDAAQS
jgi:predicted nuclease of predicted toxin-antitoxin system